MSMRAASPAALHPTVLVVEDETLIRMLAADSLADSGYKVLEAADATEALRILEEHDEVAVLFTDVNMPGSIDGFEFARLVRQGWPDVGILVISGKVAPKPGDLPLASGGHGVKWAGRDKYWMAVPASGKLYLMNAEEGTVARSIQAPTVRTHGIALEGDHIWCAGSDEAEIYKLQMSDGAIVAKIVLDKANDPSLHGLDIKDGVLWYCDANKGWICNLT